MFDSPGFWRIRVVSALATLLTTSAVFGGALWLLAAQVPPRQPPVEEEEAPKPATPPAPAGNPQASRPAPRNQAPSLEDLASEAKRAPVAVRKLYEALATPHDVVTWQDGRRLRVAPATEYVGPHAQGEGSVNLRVMEDDGSLRPMHPYPLREMNGIDHFEVIAGRAVDHFLKTGLAPDAPSSAKPLPPAARLEVAEKVLAAVVRFHDATREAGRRDPGAWKDVGRELHARLLAVQQDRLKSLADADDWPKAVELAFRLSKAYASDRAVQNALAIQLGRLVEQSVKRKDYAQAQARLRALEDQFPSSPAATPVRDELKRQAEALLAQAREKANANDRDGALETLRLAENVWPDLPGLRDYRLQLGNAYPQPLGVGVHELPEDLSPGTAVTDSERQAVELVFEGLVKEHYRQAVGESFDPVLSDGLPQVVPLGRRFRLSRDAHWPNGDPVTSADVRTTLDLLRKPDWDRYLPGWAELVQAPPPSQDPFQAEVRLRQGFLEPLSLMAFKILPVARNLERPDDPEFAKHPTGTGPFRFEGRTPAGDACVFLPNPHYHRTSKPGMPYLREIRMFHSGDPARDFQTGRLHLLLDLPTDRLRTLKSLEKVDLFTLRNRRVYFLAVNHRVPALRNRDVRKALAHAINRDEILDAAFRADLRGTTEVPHRSLNGPYPPECWAAKPGVHDLFDANLARGLAERARAAAAGAKLRLKYPEDQAVKKACELLRDQVKAATGLDLELVPRSPRELYQDIERLHDYELAYYHYDFPDERYWLWPLFDPADRALAAGGGNFLGYRNDSELESELQATMNHRDPEAVRRAARAVQAIVVDKMPLIPLWQLDSHIAVQTDLKIPGLTVSDELEFNPLLVFSDAETWKLEPK